MIAIRSREPAEALMDLSQPPRLTASSFAACGDVHGSVMLTPFAMRSNCHCTRPMSTRPSSPSFGIVPW